MWDTYYNTWRKNAGDKIQLLLVFYFWGYFFNVLGWVIIEFSCQNQF